MGGLGEAVEAQRQRDPKAHRQALTERAGRDLDPRGAVHVRVTLEVSADLTQPHQVLAREVAGVRQRRVLNRRRVTLAEHEAVALRPVGVLRIVAKHPVIQRRHHVRGRQRRVEVPRLRDREHRDAVHPQHRRPAFELGDRRLAVGARRGLRIRDRPQVGHVREVSRRHWLSRYALGGRQRRPGSPENAGLMRAKRITFWATALALVAGGCGDEESQTAPTVTVAIPSTSTGSSTTAAPPPVGEPSSPAETPPDDPRVNELERDAGRTVRCTSRRSTRATAKRCVPCSPRGPWTRSSSPNPVATVPQRSRRPSATATRAGCRSGRGPRCRTSASRARRPLGDCRGHRGQPLRRPRRGLGRGRRHLPERARVRAG